MPDAERADLVVRGATVFDGSGDPGVVADVAVADDTIVAVGDVPERGGVEVDGAGLALTPGFIDVHSHDDFAVFLTPEMDFKVGQGVTTTIVGNCGLGAAPFSAAHVFLAFFGALDMADGLPTWDGHAGYLAAVDADPPSCNVAMLAGHGTLRLAAMGLTDDAPTGPQSIHMADLVEDAVNAGAVGLSTGLVYEPGKHAATSEIVDLVGVMAGSGARYTSHIRNEGTGLLEAVSEAITVGRETGVSVQISHHKAAGEAAWGLVNRSIELIDAARAEGLDVLADQYPYTAGSTALAALVSNGAFDGGDGLGAVPPGAVVVVSSPDRPELEGESIATIAADLGLSPSDAAESLVDREGNAVVVVIHSMCEDDVRTVMRHPTTMIGSDGVPTLGGKPHPRLYGTFARVLGTYVRDEGVLDLPTAVHRMTGMPASAFGLAGRGRIEPGAVADLVLFDPSTIADVATYDDPRRHPDGVVGVWVNGRRVVADGEHTGDRPGRSVRRS